MKPLIQYKWRHYQEFYDKFLPERAENILEIGVARGGSIAQWRNLYPEANIFGVDIDSTHFYNIYRQVGGNVHLIKGSIMDRKILTGLSKSNYDVIVDDGGHRPHQILTAFTWLWPQLNEGGLYVIEDVHVSEKPRWQAWQKVFGGPRSILMDLYSELNTYFPDSVMREGVYPVIHLCPMAIFIEKRKVKIAIHQQDVKPTQLRESA